MSLVDRRESLRIEFQGGLFKKDNFIWISERRGFSEEEVCMEFRRRRFFQRGIIGLGEYLVGKKHRRV